MRPKVAAALVVHRAVDDADAGADMRTIRPGSGCLTRNDSRQFALYPRLGGPLLSMGASMHKLTAGSGDDYLTRQVAAQDTTEKGHTSLASYYSEKGEIPGT